MGSEHLFFQMDEIYDYVRAQLITFETDKLSTMKINKLLYIL